MPSINEMFPSLDYDTLNRGLNFINFGLPGMGVQVPNMGMDPSFDDHKFKDGVDEVSTIEVNEQEVPKAEKEKEWDKLTKSERIERVKQESSGMPIISQIDLSSLRKVAKQMDKKGMYKESVQIFKVAENFTKSITLNEQEVDGKHDESASVNLSVDKDGEPISINKTFTSGEEAMDFYNKFVLPGVEEIMQMEGSMKHFGFVKEAIELRRFLRAVRMQLPVNAGLSVEQRDTREADKVALPIIQEEVVTKETQEICPHCKEVIGEKEMFLPESERGNDIKGSERKWQHKCGGLIIYPNEVDINIEDLFKG